MSYLHGPHLFLSNNGDSTNSWLWAESLGFSKTISCLHFPLKWGSQQQRENVYYNFRGISRKSRFAFQPLAPLWWNRHVHKRFNSLLCFEAWATSLAPTRMHRALHAMQFLEWLFCHFGFVWKHKTVRKTPILTADVKYLHVVIRNPLVHPYHAAFLHSLHVVQSVCHVTCQHNLLCEWMWFILIK